MKVFGLAVLAGAFIALGAIFATTVLAGSIRCSQDPFSPKVISWRSDIEQVSFGKGKIIFCQYRIFEPGFLNPVATHLVRNLIGLAA